MKERSFECPDGLWQAIEATAAESGLPVDAWLREILTRVVRRELVAPDVARAVDLASESG